MMRNNCVRPFLTGIAITAIVGGLGARSHAQLLIYEPFNYTTGANLGGTDPDGAGPTAGDPTLGQSGTYVGGGTYKWHAHGTTSNYQSPNDAVISSGSLSYPGLATSQGNSVSYGSSTDNSSLYADAISLQNPISSGSLYASFIVRIKSNVSGTNQRHDPAGLLAEATSDANAGSALASQSGSTTAEPSMFWMRKEANAPFTDTDFGVGKTTQDGIGPGAIGPSAGWQNASSAFVETNQFGNTASQAPVDFNTPATYQTYFVVLKCEFNAANTSSDDFDPPGSSPASNGQSQVVSLWMNPGSGTLGKTNGEILASQNPAGNLGSYYAAVDAYGTATADSSIIRSFALFGHRQNTPATIAMDFDELRIGLTWADVTPTAAAGQLGDFNNDGKVDAADYATWRKNDTAQSALPNDGGAANQADRYTLWRSNFGKPPGAGTGLGGASVPEPTSMLLLGVAGNITLVLGRRRQSRDRLSRAAS